MELAACALLFGLRGRNRQSSLEQIERSLRRASLSPPLSVGRRLRPIVSAVVSDAGSGRRQA